MQTQQAEDTRRTASMRRRKAAGGSAGAPRYAAVDLGTHNCRMLIAHVGGDGGLRVVDALSTPVRLGEGLAANGRLGEAAMARALSALDHCARRMRAAGVQRTRAVATEACRRAANGAEFLARVRTEIGIDLRTISSDEESGLTLAGCAPLLDRRRPRALLFDIGGGSTEVVWIEQSAEMPARPLGLLSLPMGVMTLGERCGTDRIEPDVFAGMIDPIVAALQPFETRHAIARDVAEGRVQMIGTSGTVTTLAAVMLGLRRYRRARIDGIDVPFDVVAVIGEQLAASDRRSRAAVPCIGADRADLVVAACAILAAIRRCWPAPSLRVADRGIREGLLLHMMAEDGAGALPCSG